MASNKHQPNILVVDDQEDITWSLSQALSDKELNASVITAATGMEALDKLSGQTINILITDVKMLEVNDQDLFIEIRKKYPAATVIVMTTLPTAGFNKEAVIGDKLFFVEKPFDINKLKQLVIKIITDKGPVDPSQSGINLADVVQLKCMAGSTTALQINKTNQEGTIFFKNGDLIHATCGQKEGEDAFFEILSFGKGVITTSLFLETVAVTITRPGTTLVKEHVYKVEIERIKAAEREAARKRAEEKAAARIKAENEARIKAEEEEERIKAEEEARRKKAEEEEERRRAEEERKRAEEEAKRIKAEEEEERKKAEEEAREKKAEEEEERKKAEEEAKRKKAEEEEARKKAEEEEAARKKAEEEEAARRKIEEAEQREKNKARIVNTGLKDLITGISNIEDYIAVGVLASSGKLLIHESLDETLDLETLGGTFNTLFRKVRKTSKKVDFNGCRENIFSYAEDKTVIIRRSGTGENMYFHLMAIMDSNRNLDLVSRVMDDFQSRTRKKLSEL